VEKRRGAPHRTLNAHLANCFGRGRGQKPAGATRLAALGCRLALTEIFVVTHCDGELVRGYDSAREEWEGYVEHEKILPVLLKTPKRRKASIVSGIRAGLWGSWSSGRSRRAGGESGFGRGRLSSPLNRSSESGPIGPIRLSSAGSRVGPPNADCVTAWVLEYRLVASAVCVFA
jgi:hypothetical protein